MESRSRSRGSAASAGVGAVSAVPAPRRRRWSGDSAPATALAASGDGDARDGREGAREGSRFDELQIEDSLEAFTQHVSMRSASSGRIPSGSSCSTGGGGGSSSSRPVCGPEGDYAHNYGSDARMLPQAHVSPMIDVSALPSSPPAVAAPDRHRGSTPAAAVEAPLGVLVATPTGQHLQLDILSTWGDPYYVGLSALEVFDERGAPIELADPHVQLRADPADINVLPEYGHDVRVVSNLFDGVLRTCDDAHLWLAPFTPGRSNHVFVDLGSVRTIGMVRVWNYNKSRIHSFRGVRMLEMFLDGQPIFRGEVNKAPGALHEVEKAAEPILFTMDAEVLQAIEEHDRALFEFEVRARTPPSARHCPRPDGATRTESGGAARSPPTASGAASCHLPRPPPTSQPWRARRIKATRAPSRARARAPIIVWEEPQPTLNFFS